MALVISIPKVEHARVPVVVELEPITTERVASGEGQSNRVELPSNLILSDATVVPAYVDFEQADGSSTSLFDANIYTAAVVPRPSPIVASASSVSKTTKTLFTVDPDSDVPALLQKIGYCESGNRQFDSNGNVIRGRVNPKDVGKYQINEYYWSAEAKRLGFNIYTEAGNTAMALEIYRRQGSQPWYSSKPCWGN